RSSSRRIDRRLSVIMLREGLMSERRSEKASESAATRLTCSEMSVSVVLVAGLSLVGSAHATSTSRPARSLLRFPPIAACLLMGLCLFLRVGECGAARLRLPDGDAGVAPGTGRGASGTSGLQVDA